MQENIIDFMKKVNIIDKNLSQYKDEEKGISFFIIQ